MFMKWVARERSKIDRIASLIAGITGIALTVGASAADVDWGKVDQALGKPGTSQPGGVHKYGLPRTDLKITVDGVAIKPNFGRMTRSPSSAMGCAPRLILPT
jgi:hypothetical protein